MTMPLEADAIRKSYRSGEVLRGVTFTVAPGEIVAISGENGAGKSTLLRILAGLLEPDSGTVRLRGRSGYCDQDPQLFPGLTVAEHLAWFARAYGLADEVWRPHAAALLERFSFARYASKRVSELSAGTAQKLHLALALLHQPDLLILDEPYVAFDWQTYLEFWELAAELRARGDALLVVSHIAYERQRFDRVLALRDGVVTCG